MKKLIEMETWRDEYFLECGTKYKNHVNKFIKYLKMVNKAGTPNLVQLEDIEKSVEYYSSQGQIKSRASMESHLESIKSFYDYLLKKGKSPDIFTQMNYEEFKNNLVEKYNLSEKVPRKSFPVETIKKILVSLDENLENNYFEISGIKDKERYIQRTLLRLFIKITLIAPAKRQDICGIKFCDFTNDFKNLTINSVCIRVPSGLTQNIKLAISISEHRGQPKYKPDDRFFNYIFIHNFSDEYLNMWFYYFLRDNHICEVMSNKQSYPIEPIMITAIEDMVKRMVSPALISKINGSKIGSIEEKYYKNGFEDMKIEISVNQAINWEIAKSEYYNYI